MIYVYEGFLTDQAGRSRGIGYVGHARRYKAKARARSVHFTLAFALASGIVGMLYTTALSGLNRLDGERVGLSNKAVLASS